VVDAIFAAGKLVDGRPSPTMTAKRAYMDAFGVLTLIVLAAVPLALAPHKVKLGGRASMGH
jgi:hypothetical protein